ncbi:hypothetical protein WJX77_010440 [Trebouxia sp. C0004]
MARACGACFSSVQAVFLVSGLVFAFICSASGASRPPPPPPTGGYAGFREQMYLNNGNTGQCECCYPDWASSTPNQTFMVPFLNSTSMPDWWSDNRTYQNWGALLFSYLKASAAQDYAFQINVNSAARLWVNNTLIINATCEQTAYGSNPTSTANNATAWTGSITLPIGYYNITLEYHSGASGVFQMPRHYVL